METSVSNNTRIFSVLRCIFVGANTVVCSSFSGLSSEFRNAKSTEKPPLPKVHVTKKPMQPKQSDTTKKASAKSSKVNKFINSSLLYIDETLMHSEWLFNCILNWNELEL